MTYYQIKDWNVHFENNKSRERNHCSFACLPNKQDGLGYGMLLNLQNGTALYGAFVAVVLVCSKQPRPRNGWITDNGQETGRPLNPAELSIKTKVPANLISRMIEATSSSDVGWLLCVECPLSARVVPVSCPGIEGREEKEGTGRSPPGPAPPPIEQVQQALNISAAANTLADMAAQVYGLYPRKVARPEALKAILKCFQKVEPNRLTELTRNYALAVAKWPENDRHFVPHPATWFNQERFNDDPATWARNSDVRKASPAQIQPHNGGNF